LANVRFRSEFKGEFDRLLRKYGIDHHLTAPNHPQTNGLTEKHNATIVTSLNKMVKDHPERWDTKIPGFLLGYRASRHCATKVSPFYMTYARHPLLPISLTPIQEVNEVPDPVTHTKKGRGQEEINDKPNPKDSEDFVVQRKNDETRMTSYVKPKVLEEIEKAQAKNQSDYQRKRAKTNRPAKNYKGEEITSLGVGDMVTISPKGRAAKINKNPTIYKVKKVGEDRTPTQGKVELVDNSQPPQAWWEPVTNVGLFMRAEELPHMH